MELRLYIRQKKTFDRANPTQEIHYAGNNPKSLVKTLGGLPSVRQLPLYAPNHEFIDITDYVSDLFKIKLVWTQEVNNAGEVLTIGNEQKKTQSGLITVEGEGYGYIKKWLVDDPSAPLNVLQVKLEHVGVGTYTDWEITGTGIEWCEGEICQFAVTMKQAEISMQCIRNTVIDDNHQGWFPLNGQPAGNKKHPRFSYCNELRPNSTLVIQWTIMGLILPVYVVIQFVLGTIINSIMGVFIAILNIVKFIIKITGGDSSGVQKSIDDLKTRIITLSDVKDYLGNLYLESAGCGREHPAPLVRDYIKNVCDKCGVGVDANTIPLFFAEYLTIETSADRHNKTPAKNRWNPHYNVCYLASTVQKGVRRLNSLSPTAGITSNTTTFWESANRPLLTLDELLDQLKGIYNASWRVVNNKLYFQRKDYWLEDNAAFDFSKNAPDNALLIHGLCYEWNEKTNPAYIKGIYSLDASDTAGNSVLNHANSAVSTGNIDENPTFDGSLDKTTQFAGAKFRLDGADNDYIVDAMQQVLNAQFTSGNILAPLMLSNVKSYLNEFADYALLIQHETTTLPKLIIWDGRSYLNAKAYKPHTVVPISTWGVPPAINLRYNIPTPLQWAAVHEPKTKTLGQANSSGSFPYGYYSAVQLLGGGGGYSQPAFLTNYPMYFDHRFEGTLWDWFHWIDDPAFNPGTNRTITIRMELCAETLKRIKPFNDSNNIILGQKIKTSDPLTPEATITSIEISYDTADRDGMYILIKANA